jgi:signal transduction histidine kinase
MDSLLDSLLHYSRVGRMQLVREDVDLNEVLLEAREALAARLAEKPRFEISTPRPLPTHNCDPIRVREVFTNLISNSLKYTATEAGKVEVGFSEPGEPDRPTSIPAGAEHERIFHVKDNGIGIAPRHFEHIFELFRRLHPRDGYGGGTGAGLTIVKRAVERHGGRIWLTSAEGAGTQFYFTLPIQAEQY